MKERERGKEERERTSTVIQGNVVMENAMDKRKDWRVVVDEDDACTETRTRILQKEQLIKGKS